MNLLKLIVKTKNKKYPIVIGENILKKTDSFFKSYIPNCKKIALIVDKNVPNTIGNVLKKSLKNYEILFIKIHVNEKKKSFKTIESLLNRILKKNFNRNDCIIALGGGILGDISGLTASLLKRGIRFVNVPTTLLAQVDSSIGGKTAVNLNLGKNLIGTFHQPDLVIADTLTLRSLPKREMICGYAEILKHALILDKKFFYWLNKKGKEIINLSNKTSIKKAIFLSCKIKSKIVQKDEKEKNLRQILNFGHTFGHAFEATKKFSKKLNHGESVLLGMICAIRFSFKKKKELELIQNHYSSLGLPYKIKKFFRRKDIAKLIKFMKSDKKNYDKNIKLILINQIGKAAKPKNYSENKIKEFLLSILS